MLTVYFRKNFSGNQCGLGPTLKYTKFNELMFSVGHLQATGYTAHTTTKITHSLVRSAQGQQLAKICTAFFHKKLQVLYSILKARLRIAPAAKHAYLTSCSLLQFLSGVLLLLESQPCRYIAPALPALGVVAVSASWAATSVAVFNAKKNPKRFLFFYFSYILAHPFVSMQCSVWLAKTRLFLRPELVSALLFSNMRRETSSVRSVRINLL
jgi:hypothetical protein